MDDMYAFERDTELYSPAGIAVALLIVVAGAALAVPVWLHAVLLAAAIVALWATLRGAIRFDRRRLRARGREHLWSDLVEARIGEERGRRLLRLTFPDAVVTVSSRMLRFARLAAFVAARQNQAASVKARQPGSREPAGGPGA